MRIVECMPSVVLLTRETDLDFICVALRNGIELLDTRTECRDLNFRTNEKTEITRFDVKYVKINLRNFVG